ncbi:MAG: 30S ribosomal protein S16 [Candidatus Paceibacterota bacterium]|jgi:small subunit ribosomal protein S16
MSFMLMIRLQRIGRTNSPHFRVVLTDKRNSPKSGKFLEILGSYGAKKGDFKVNGERVKYWISQGAKVSDTMHNFLITHKVTTGKKINVLPSKHPIKKEAPEVKETPVAAEAAPAEAPAA